MGGVYMALDGLLSTHTMLDERNEHAVSYKELRWAGSGGDATVLPSISMQKRYVWLS